MKKALALLCALMMLLTLAACSGQSASSEPTEKPVADGAPAEDAAPADDEIVAPVDYPIKNINCIMPYGAGGTMDTLGRLVFECIPEDMKPDIQFTVENIAGSGGLVGTEQALTYAADGYTLCGVNGDLIINHAIGATDIVLEEDFTPLVCLQDEPYCLIGPAEGECSTLEGFMDKVRSGDDAVTVAISGEGTPGGLAVKAIQKAFGVSIKTISYSDSTASALAVVTGECDATFTPVTVVTGQVEAGELAVIAVTTETEAASLPGIPAIAEQYEELKDMNLRSFCMIGAVGNPGDEIINYLSSILNASVASDAYADQTAGLGMTPVVWSVEDMIDYCATVYQYYVSILAE